MDYFFRCQKSTFSVENNKHIYTGNFFVYHVTGSTYSKSVTEKTEKKTKKKIEIIKAWILLLTCVRKLTLV